MSAVFHPHPRFDELRDEFRTHPHWFTRWNGTFFRFQTVAFPRPRDVLSGEGAARRGGRWNLPGLPTLYGSTTDRTALDECKANDRYYGVQTKSPRLVVAIEARLTHVLDLTNPALRRKLGLTLKGLAAEDWRALLEARKESLTQVLGRAVADAGGSGVVVPSAAVARGVNVVVFPGIRRADRLTVVEGEQLEELGVKTNT